MHDKIKALKKENNELRKMIASLEEAEVDFIENEKMNKEREDEAHNVEKKAFKDEIATTKVELDKLMSSKLII